MDGLKARLNESVRLRLSFALSVAILIVTIAAGVVSFTSAFREAHHLQDDVLRQLAALVQRQSSNGVVDLGSDTHGRERDEDERIIIQPLSPPQENAPPKNPDLSAVATLADGLHTIDAGGVGYRVLVRTFAPGQRYVIGQETAVRNESARDSALRTIAPLLFLVPVLLVVVAKLVTTMFQPIAAVAAEIDQRGEQDLNPVSAAALPLEVRPFATAINRLLERIAQALAAQRRFVADAAHELRSPLTALSLQAERLSQADMPADARERLVDLRQGIERQRNLLDKLLTLARVQSTAPSQTTRLSIRGLFRDVLETLMPLAEAKNIDLGVEDGDDITVQFNELALRTVIHNLVDNAIRYSPPNGRIDLAMAREGKVIVLKVADTGPGIPPSEQDRVFDPFYRLLGNEQIGAGLGLSIVKEIAQRTGMTLSLGYADPASQSGLCVTIALRDVLST